MRRSAHTSAVNYEEIAPAAELRDLVRCYWCLSDDGNADASPPDAADPALPDGSPELIFNLGDPFAAHRDHGPPIQQPLIMLVGQITGPFLVGPTGRVDLIAVRFEAHGAALLHDDMAEMTGRWAGAYAIAQLDAESVHAALAAAPSRNERVALLDYALRQLRATHVPDPRVVQAVRAIRESNGMVPLDELARAIGVTPHCLQRLFSVQVGISPKLLARITRFQRVFSAWRAEPGSLARVAAECGYSDPSHLVRDVRDFAGAAPAAFLAEQPEFTGFFVAR